MATEVAGVPKDLTLGRESVSAPRGEGPAEARTGFKGAGHRPAAQEGAGEKSECPLFSSRSLGPCHLLSTSWAQSWEDAHWDEWRGCQPPQPHFASRHCAQLASSQERTGTARAAGCGGLCVLGDSNPSGLQPTASGGLLGTGRATWAPLGEGKEHNSPGVC